jgi:hypothetical protein
VYSTILKVLGLRPEPEPPKKIVAVIFDGIGPSVISSDWEYFHDNDDFEVVGILNRGEIEYRQYSWRNPPPD